MEIELWIDGEDLKFRAPRGRLTPALRDKIVARKADILAWLRQVNLEAQGPAPPIPPLDRTGELPLSFTQKRLWFLDQFDQDNRAYNLSLAWEIAGTLNVSVVEQSVQALVQRHEVLRTAFPAVDGKPVQAIQADSALTVSLIDLSRESEVDQMHRVQREAAEDARQPFDLSKGPLMRVTLLRLAESAHVLLVTLHHIVFDGWSFPIFLRDFKSFYTAFMEGTQAKLPDLAVQYVDYADWQRRCLEGDYLESLLTYWRQQLEGVPQILQLPIDRERPRVQTFRGARQVVLLPKPLVEGLKALGHREGTTLFMTLLAAFKVLLFRYTSQDDLVVGTPVAGRDHVDMEHLIGCFINTLVLRTQLTGALGFLDLLGQVRETALGAYAHQALPFETLVEALPIERDLSRNPLFQVMFGLQHAPSEDVEMANLKLTPLRFERDVAQFDLALDCWEYPDQVRGFLEYNTALFDAATMRRMARHFQTLLEGIVSIPDQPLAALPLLLEAERDQVLQYGTGERAPVAPARGLHQLIEQQVERTPDAIALVYGDQQLTYRELNRRANQLAHQLRALGVEAESQVGLYLDRSLESAVSLLGILKSGGGYVPLEPSLPTERLIRIVEEVKPQAWVTQSSLLPQIPLDLSRSVCCVDTLWDTLAADTNPVNLTFPENVAYVIYTSGSTGGPKGVAVSHRALMNHSLAMAACYQVQATDRVLQFASLSFDVAAEEFFPAWLSGATVVLSPGLEALLPIDFQQFVASERVTILNVPPSFCHLWMTTLEAEKANCLSDLRLTIVGSEPVEPQWLAQWQALFGQRVGWLNAYGLTETTITTTLYESAYDPEAEVSHVVPIGQPIANTQTYVLGDGLSPVPLGVPGQLYIGGEGVSRGYLNQPGLTAARFIPNPCGVESGARLYQTGDRVQCRPSGQFVFLGRLDHQVKLRGYRIELGEIEATLQEHPAIQQAVVVLDGAGPVAERLVAYCVFRQPDGPDRDDLQRFLHQKLPDAMVPALIVPLDAVPLTQSGTLNRRLLPDPEMGRVTSPSRRVVPRTPMEEMVAGVWESILQGSEFSIDDNFFSLGGHSLMAVQVTSRLRELLYQEVPLRAVFDTPTVAGLARYLEMSGDANLSAPPPPITAMSHQGSIPLSLDQKAMWQFDQLLPGSPFFNMPLTVRLEGELNLAALEKSVYEIIRRHDSLRTTVSMVNGVPEQSIAATTGFTFIVEDLQVVAENEVVALQLARQEGLEPFDLVEGPLWRLRVLQLSSQAYILLITLHHIICDGWSMRVLIEELSALYDAYCAGYVSPLQPLSIQYADFVQWQYQWRYGQAWEAQLAYWQQQLAGPLSTLELPIDHARPEGLNLRTSRLPFKWPRELFEAATRLGQEEGCTLFMVLLAAFNILLHRYTDQDDLRVGSLVANRSRPEVERLIGLCMNTVILRTRLNGNPSLRGVLQRVRETTLAAYTHQDLPCEDLLQALEQRHNIERLSLFQVMLILQNTSDQPLSLSGVTATLLESHYLLPTTCDWVLIMSEGKQGLQGDFLYKTSLFEAETIEKVLIDFQYILDRLAFSPDKLLSSIR